MQKEHLYQSGDVNCKGYVVYPSQFTANAILIAPTWEGMSDFAKSQAETLAKKGYLVFVADLYGNSKVATSSKEAESLMTPLFLNRFILRERIIAAFDELKNFESISKILAIGFCFGGLTVIELMKSGANLSGVVSFHGLLGSEYKGTQAQLAPVAKEIYPSFLLLHGYKDPLVNLNDVLELQTLLSKKNVDWQTHIYGEAAHGFTNPKANDVNSGLYFDEKNCKRSMETLYNYLREQFDE